MPNNTSPAYTLLNARLDIAAPGGWGLFAWGRNLTNAVYFPELNGAARLVGAPATGGIGANYRF